MGQNLPVLMLSVLLMVQLCVELSVSKQFFVLIAPNVLHTGNDEKIIIQCHECTSDKDLMVDIMVNNFPTDDKRLHKTVTRLNAANNYLASANIKIPYDYLSSDSNEKQYVIVRAISGPLFKIEKVILVSPHTGYIFIQTDKTIYTPNQNVNFRIFSTDQNLDPAEREVIVLIQNPNGVIVEREEKMILKGLLAFNLKIPELVSFGTWKIIAKFSLAQQKEYTTQFEVQEYVLPTFNVELQTKKKFFYYKDEELVVNIQARYLFRKNVKGYAVAIFVLYKDSLKTLHGSMQRVEINNGEGIVVLKRAQLLESVTNENELLGHYIYANVTVFSSDGDYVTTHKTNIRIVSSPYNIAFTRTPSYFKPGLPFKLTVSVKNPDMTPAQDVPVVFGEIRGLSTEEGLVHLTINTQATEKELSLTVKTADEGLEDEQQAKVTMTAKAYQPAWTQSFLHIDSTRENNAVYSRLQIQSNSSIAENVKYFTILITSRGKILQTIFQKRSGKETISAVQFDVTQDMLPSFRIVAYFYVFHSGILLEFVSDSVMLNRKRTCKGTLTMKDKNTANFYEPQGKVELQLTGDKGAYVGLVAVDKAVFVLNNKSRLTQDKIWDDVQQNDIGCTAGSGANSLGVFQDAGLDFATTLDIQTPARRDFTCSSNQHGRSRRSIEILEAKQKKASATPADLRPCCLAGLHESPMGLSCSKRRKQVQQGKECTDVFFECCLHAEELRKRLTADLGWDRSDDIEEDLEDYSTPRSQFPESWRWSMLQLNAESRDNTVTVPVDLNLPDSITTWIIQAISIRKDKGICVSEPYEVTTYKPFFVDLRLPYSVRKNEQVQIRAILHNYMSNQAMVKVKFFYNENMCSLATKSRGYQETVKVPSQSSKVVHFVVIPLVETDVYIDVLATVSQLSISDRVKKILHVLPEGKLLRKQTFCDTINPTGSPQKIHIQTKDLEGMVPNSVATNFISIQGDIMGESLLGILDDSYLGSLIYLPYGCPEQNMISTTPNVILTKYLDATKKWDAVGAERRSSAIHNIKTGYNKQLSYFSGDSFQRSTWLTAYVVKIFSMALKANLVYVDRNMLCNSSIWLVDNQKDNGEFMEPGVVYAKSMQGGYAESESSLTAFVLIALAELGDTCNHTEIAKAIKKAEKYLATELPELKHTYSAVITSYALSLVGNHASNDIIDSFASKDGTHWPVEHWHSLFTVEATGYALLQKLKLRKFEESHKIAEWLVKVRDFGGGYRSTQATVVALQALAQYQTDTSTPHTVNLGVQIIVDGRDKPFNYTIRNSDVYLERTSKFPANKNLDIEVTGTGKGTITVMTVYQALLNADKQCNGFTLEAEVKEHEKAATYTLHLRTRYHGDLPATMTVIEITLLSGFSPNTEDLKKLTDQVENYVMKFETQTSASNQTVVLYLEKVPNENFEIGFRIHTEFEIGLLQPADISIYEYYDLDKKCSTFYNLPKESGHLKKICKGSVCKCATEKCLSLDVMTDEETLKKKACASGVDFVIKVRLTSSSRQASFDSYNFTILDVIKEGEDIKYQTTNHYRQFLKHMACSLELQTNTEYLIMNRYSVWELSSSISYMFSSETFILIWPEEDDTLKKFTENMKLQGCDT